MGARHFLSVEEILRLPSPKETTWRFKWRRGVDEKGPSVVVNTCNPNGSKVKTGEQPRLHAKFEASVSLPYGEATQKVNSVKARTERCICDSVWQGAGLPELNI